MSVSNLEYDELWKEYQHALKEAREAKAAAYRHCAEVLAPWLRHADDCDAAAWEARNRHHLPTYARPACSCGLDDASARCEAQAKAQEQG